MKKFIIFILILTVYYPKSLFAYKNTLYIVTAYYSPIPNQKRYSYNYYLGRYRTFKEEKILQGEGHTSASGKKMKPGFLAAPSKYPFGTKIYFEGYGVGVVEDRGGAIVKAGKQGYEHDRIDIWMGYGYEGLQRSLKWGKRIIKGRVVSINQKVNLKFAKNILDGLEEIIVNPENHLKEDVKKLQSKFKELGLYNGKIDGNYESIKKSLIKFQLDNRIIRSKNQIDAGRFGPKTYTKLLQKFGSTDVLIKQKNIKIKEINPKIHIILDAPKIQLNGDDPQKEEVIKVQRLFKKLGLYNGKIDGNYKNIKDIILKIQKYAGIIKNENDRGAGYFGEKTKAALVKYYENKKNITIDDINYKTLDEIGKKIKKMNKIKVIKLTNKLKKVLKILKKDSQIKKINYLINILEK